MFATLAGLESECPRQCVRREWRKESTVEPPLANEDAPILASFYYFCII